MSALATCHFDAQAASAAARPGGHRRARMGWQLGVEIGQGGGERPALSLSTATSRFSKPVSYACPHLRLVESQGRL